MLPKKLPNRSSTPEDSGGNLNLGLDASCRNFEVPAFAAEMASENYYVIGPPINLLLFTCFARRITVKPSPANVGIEVEWAAASK
jgi:hypothetical protein